jgi:hypothetical protein
MARNDLVTAMSTPNVEINMHVFIRLDADNPDVCMVCLAGSMLLPIRPVTWGQEGYHFLTEEVQNLMQAIDCIRLGTLAGLLGYMVQMPSLLTLEAFGKAKSLQRRYKPGSRALPECKWDATNPQQFLAAVDASIVVLRDLGL